MYLGLLILASLLFAAGGLCMKLSEGMSKLTPSILIFIFFCAGAACQAIAMKRAELGVAYVAVLGLEAIAAFGISVFVLHESAGAGRVIAIILIVGGIVLLERN